MHIGAGELVIVWELWNLVEITRKQKDDLPSF